MLFPASTNDIFSVGGGVFASGKERTEMFRVGLVLSSINQLAFCYFWKTNVHEEVAHESAALCQCKCYCHFSLSLSLSPSLCVYVSNYSLTNIFILFLFPSILHFSSTISAASTPLIYWFYAYIIYTFRIFKLYPFNDKYIILQDLKKFNSTTVISSQCLPDDISC